MVAMERWSQAFRVVIMGLVGIKMWSGSHGKLLAVGIGLCG